MSDPGGPPKPKSPEAQRMADLWDEVVAARMEEIAEEAELAEQTRLAADPDGDGITTGEEEVAEVEGFVTQPDNADTDGDNLADNDEIANRTDPPKGTPKRQLMARAPNADFQALLEMRRVYGRPPLIKAKDITDFNRLTVLLLEGPLAKEQRSEMGELLAKMFFEADGIDLKAIYDTDPEAGAEIEKLLTRLQIDLEERKALLEGRKPKAPAKKAPAKKAPAKKAPDKKEPATPVSAETPEPDYSDPFWYRTADTPNAIRMRANEAKEVRDKKIGFISQWVVLIAFVVGAIWFFATGGFQGWGEVDCVDGLGRTISGCY